MNSVERIRAWTKAAACRYLTEANESHEALKVDLVQCEPIENTPIWISEAFAEAWLARNHPWNAVPHLRHLCGHRHGWPGNFWKLVEALIRSGEADVAFAEVVKQTSELGSDPKWHTSRAFALHKMGRLAEAEDSVAKSLQSYPSNPALLKRQASLKRKLAFVELTENSYRQDGSWERILALKNRFAGERCFIIGNGPSLLEQDIGWLKNERTFVTNWFVNHPQCNEISPDFYCVCSHAMFGGWKGDVEPRMNPEFRTALLSNAAASHKFFSYKFRPLIEADPAFHEQKVDYLIFDNPKKKIHAEGRINPDLSGFQYNGYTGIMTFCFPLAFHLGFSKIYLVGCDSDYKLTTPDQPKSYFYRAEDHPTPTTTFENLVREWAPDGPVFQAYRVIRQEAENRNIQVYNATAGGRLEVFPREALETLTS